MIEEIYNDISKKAKLQKNDRVCPQLQLYLNTHTHTHTHTGNNSGRQYKNIQTVINST